MPIIKRYKCNNCGQPINEYTSLCPFCGKILIGHREGTDKDFRRLQEKHDKLAKERKEQAFSDFLDEYIGIIGIIIGIVIISLDLYFMAYLFKSGRIIIWSILLIINITLIGSPIIIYGLLMNHVRKCWTTEEKRKEILREGFKKLAIQNEWTKYYTIINDNQALDSLIEKNNTIEPCKNRNMEIYSLRPLHPIQVDKTDGIIYRPYWCPHIIWNLFYDLYK